MASLSVEAFPSSRHSGNVWIPQGLLQSVGNHIHKRNSRSVVSEQNDSITIEQIVKRPAQAVLTNTLTTQQRHPSIDFNHHVRPRIHLGRELPAEDAQQTALTPSSFQRTQSPGERHSHTAVRAGRYRAKSVNVATVLRRNANLVGVDEQEAATTPRGVISSTSPVLPHRVSTSKDPRPTAELHGNEAHFRTTDFASSRPRAPHAYGSYGSEGRVSPFGTRSSPTRFLYVEGPGVEKPGHLKMTSMAPHQQLSTQRGSVLRKASAAIADNITRMIPGMRKTSVRNTLEKAQVRQKRLQRSKPFQLVFQYAVYLLLLAFVYLVLVGRPLWGGTVWYIYVLFEYHLTFIGGSAIFIGLAFFYAFGPLLVFFERQAKPVKVAETPHQNTEKPMFPPAPFIRVLQPQSVDVEDVDNQRLSVANASRAQASASAQTALLIPCYKSASLLPETLEAALKVFPSSNVFVLANGNSPTPLDNTEEVCDRYGVHHIWIPIGSKIVAQYVGCYVARQFPFCLLIDDDCLLPPEFPVVIDRLQPDPKTGRASRIKCLGYTITSIGANHTKGTWCQQAQDLEYKLSGLQRQFAGLIGSATFPHGAIVLWDTEFLIRTFKRHPGFSVSEDWFFGHVARILGSRITMCSSVFVETETPTSVFFSSGGARGGFGEMTVFKQRFKRWNFFFVNGMYYNLSYILLDWRLGFWEFGAKLFVFQEVYETFLYLVTPIVLPISFLVRPAYTAYLFSATCGLYWLNAVIFNELHLRKVDRQVNRWVMCFYYMPFKLALTIVNVASCWWSLWKYAKYFAKRHPKIIEDTKAVGIVLKIEEDGFRESGLSDATKDGALVTDAPGTGAQHIVGRTARSDTRSTIQSARVTPRSSLRKSSRPRRLTATAIKVDVVDSISTDQIVTEAGQTIIVQPIDEADELFHPEAVGEAEIHGRNVERLARVEEEANEEGLYGYSFYGV